MIIACLDLEGVLVPEIWIAVAEKTGIEDLRLTTRDISDYDKLMKHRISILDKHKIDIKLIQEVINKIEPLQGAVEFIGRLREKFQIIILSDTFYQFGMPLMKKLGNPTLFCHDLVIDEAGKIINYKLRMADQKRETVKRLKELNFNIIASGDSYNDTNMLSVADRGVLFCPPQRVIDEFPQYPVASNHEELFNYFIQAEKEIIK